MNVLLSNKITYVPFERDNDATERITFGDKFAVSIVGFFTCSALFVGCWSGILFLSGDIHNGGPLRYVIKVLQSFGII